MTSVEKKHLVAIFVAITVIIASISAIIITDNNRSDDNSIEFEYVHSLDDRIYKDRCYYSDGYFSTDSTTYNPSLATASLCLALSSIAIVKEPVPQYKNIMNLTTAMGFKEIDVNEDFKNVPTSDSVGVIIGNKVVDKKTIIVVGIRSANYGLEWANNLSAGTGEDTMGIHEGFYNSSNKVIDCISKYLVDHSINGSIAIWMSGFSRGACITNTVAGLLDMHMIDDVYVFGNGSTVSKTNLYAYTFGSSRCAPDTLDPHSATYNNIFNILYPQDASTMISFRNMGFERFGTDMYAPMKGDIGYDEIKETYIRIYNGLPDSESDIEYRIDDFKMPGKADWTYRDLMTDLTDRMSAVFHDDRALWAEMLEPALTDFIMSSMPTRSMTDSVKMISDIVMNSDILALISAVIDGSENEISDILIPAAEKVKEKGYDINPEKLSDSAARLIVTIRPMIEEMDGFSEFRDELLVAMANADLFEFSHCPAVAMAWLRMNDPNYS